MLPTAYQPIQPVLLRVTFEALGTSRVMPKTQTQTLLHDRRPKTQPNGLLMIGCSQGVDVKKFSNASFALVKRLSVYLILSTNSAEETQAISAPVNVNVAFRTRLVNSVSTSNANNKRTRVALIPFSLNPCMSEHQDPTPSS
ncbi:expressed unknown protein [Seminavis robusta]|uniref:Uncharacterized protein n=1 Tax=Seminavis robusta TaxID=568900 RepID=A0A9N8HE83_9STRA|nr:expressed unknown protein [Seminavis robusta]|eukprot:Sro461_g147671.1  (142) ;mRNA; r:10150-10575